MNSTMGYTTIMPKMYTNIRRKAADNADLQSVTITLPKETLIILSNNGVESGRSSGNISSFLEIAALATTGIFSNPSMAGNQLLRLIRFDINTPRAIRELADNLFEISRRIRA